jgi:hypothetical protein
LERAVLQPSLDGEAIALLDVCGGRLDQPIPADDAMELRLFFGFDRPIRGQADAGNGFPALGVWWFGVASGVAKEDDCVDAAHPSMIAIVC